MLNKFLKNKLLIAILRVIFSVAFALILTSFPLHSLEFFTYDLRFKLNPFTSKAPNIETVAIQQSTLQKFNGEPNIRLHTLMLEQLLKHDPLLIYYDLDPKNLRGTAQEQQEFTNILKKFRNHILYMKELPNKGEEYKLTVGENFKDLKYAPGYLSTDFQHFAEDNVARRALLNSSGYIYSQVKAAHLIKPISDFNDYRGSFQFGSSKQIYVNYQRTGTFSAFSFESIYSGEFLPNQFKDKIVIIGNDIKFDYKQYVKTVYSNTNFAMSTLEAQANIISSLILNNGIIKPTIWIDTLITILISLLIVFSTSLLPPTKAIQLILTTSLSYFVFAYLLFIFSGIAIAIAHPILAIFILQYLLVPFMVIKAVRQNDLNLIKAKEEKDRAISRAKVTAKSAKADLGFRIATQVAHDIKSPIMALETVRMLTRTDMKPEVQKLLDNSINRINHIADSLLKKFRSGSFETINEAISINIISVINDLIEVYKQTHSTTSIHLNSKSQEVLIPIDQTEFERAATNILNNAIEAMEFKGSILINIDENSDFATILIEDAGKGIPSNIQHQIFNTGFTYEKKHGTGIGSPKQKKQ